MLAVAYDTPVAGWRANRVNTLRLWSGMPIDPILLDKFNAGDHIGALAEFDGTVEMNAGSLEVCIPDGVVFAITGPRVSGRRDGSAGEAGPWRALMRPHK